LEKMKTLVQLRSTDFVPYLNQMFTIQPKGMKPIGLELVLVMESPMGIHRGAVQPFALYFLGPESAHYLLQNTYRLEHPELGVLNLFLVPRAVQAGRMRYEVIFG
jgi:hypothetical protein